MQTIDDLVPIIGEKLLNSFREILRDVLFKNYKNGTMPSLDYENLLVSVLAGFVAFQIMGTSKDISINHELLKDRFIEVLNYGFDSIKAEQYNELLSAMQEHTHGQYQH